MRRTRSRQWFYVLVGVLNCAVITMLFVVNIKPEAPSVLLVKSIPSRVVGLHVPSAIIGTPNRLVIPTLAIDLPVGIGSYNQSDASWTIDSTKAYYADNSVPLNDNNGNTLIYGHAQTPVFARLPDIQPDADALVYSDTGYVFRYTYQSLQQVIPTDTSVFQVNKPPALILQTCIGDWDAYRGLFSFALQSVQKI